MDADRNNQGLHDHDPSLKDSAVNVSQPERIGSIIGGGALAAYSLFNIARGKFGSLPIAALGGYLIYRGATGHCYVSATLNINTAAGEQQQSRSAVIPHKSGIKVSKSVTVNRPVEDLYAFWRDFENLPQFMNHLKSVKVMDGNGNRSHWVANAPAGQTVEWDAEIINEQANRLIAWRSLPDAQIANAGAVMFQPASGNRGTEVKVELEYNPPAGVLGALIAKLFGEEPEQQIDEDLRRFKQYMETGEVANNGQKAEDKKGLPDQKGVEVEQVVTVNLPVAQVYSFWRNFANLPHFMNHLESVTVQDGNRSHWKANAPFGQTVEWDAEVSSEKENEYIAWRSLEGAQVPNQGAVRFMPQGQTSTEVRVSLKYAPPLGAIGALAARIFGEEPNQQITEDLARLKQYLETGSPDNADKVANKAEAKDEQKGVAPDKGIRVEKSVVINRPVAEIYRYWRNFENLPHFMNHLEAVTVQDNTHSHWKAKAPLGQTVEWDAEIIAEQENHHIAWRSLPNAQVANEGAVRFTSLGDEQTEVATLIKYDPPAGALGAFVARLLGAEPNQQVEEDLNRFKQVMEHGAISNLTAESGDQNYVQ